MSIVNTSNNISDGLRGKQATESLLAEVRLTPKPGLVDRCDSGSHSDMNLALMESSALSLELMFKRIANISMNKHPSQYLRERIAEIGRKGEVEMLHATGGVNTHKGAIWALGLLTAASVFLTPFVKNSRDVCRLAAELARFPDDCYQGNRDTNGIKVQKQYNVDGAKGEATNGFPHIINIGLPMLQNTRMQGFSENTAQLYTLFAIMAELDDTCILYRGGYSALTIVKKRASKIIEHNKLNWNELKRLNKEMIEMGVSPGGSADLLAATLFLDKIENQ
ncbi:triphosphoribosyl-dephospho-CoA synthase [Virgibacillus natechei]|uniref:triphosphoribosyl-dephospho-CoA synthase n=1 Tax=Virgibacillus natechei TaxID=1216297 RepID=A0ABS4IGF7_9BACI|nr:triphosphoribosyl-dephospho-CoA synthase [Virgibacillus natechei]MBP1970033.1 triphosphoribosyl-dephospho-CoA synthase [Virgibacillus natechei]UZD14119.1 triphosphoribosyl-dephospho-CoA synthase [Virgibacillus natechei]